MTPMILLLIAPSLAQDAGETVPDLDVQLFRPSIDSDNLIWTDESTRSPDRAFSGRTFLSWMADPLVYTSAEGQRTELVSDVFQLNLIGAYTWDRFRVGVDAPVVLRSLGEITGETGLGDASAEAKVTVLERDQAPLGIALTARLGIPTSTLTGPLGSAGATFEFGAVADRRFGDALVAVNLGHRSVPEFDLENLSWNDQLVARVGAGYTVTDAVGASLDLSGRTVYQDLGNPYAAPFEAMLGGWYRPGAGDLVIRGGGGTGIGPGVGAPVARVAVSVGYQPAAALDTDLDGLVDADDVCPSSPEDMDGWQDDDGCPEPTAVQLRFEDSNGAPLVARYSLPDIEGLAESGAADLALEPGRYRLDATLEGFLPAAEMLEVPAGGPWAFVQVLSPVPPEPEVIVIAAPEPEPTLVVIPERIELADTIRFELSSATLLSQSEALLDGVATILADHPEITLLRVEGHTDSQGDAGYNQRLSEGRAAAVRDYLIRQGVAPERLTSAGFGESRPIDEREVPEAWEKNRRVDFFVEERAD